MSHLRRTRRVDIPVHHTLTAQPSQTTRATGMSHLRRIPGGWTFLSTTYRPRSKVAEHWRPNWERLLQLPPKSVFERENSRKHHHFGNMPDGLLPPLRLDPPKNPPLPTDLPTHLPARHLDGPRDRAGRPAASCGPERDRRPGPRDPRLPPLLASAKLCVGVLKSSTH